MFAEEEKINTAESTENTEQKEEKKEAAPKDKEEKKERKVIDHTVDTDDGDEDDGPHFTEEDLFKTRKSLPLSPENAKFKKSAGNLITLELINEDGDLEIFERVIILRSFPISNPDEFLSVREPDTRKKGRGKEIGMIRYITDFDEETMRILNEELALRYFTPTITKITNVKEKFGYSYWDAETTSGKVTFVLNNPYSNIRTLEDGRIFISDMDGNTFQIPDPDALDKASLRRLEVYI